MNPERQRIAIAEWCGWKEGGCGWWEGPCGQETPHLPDYMNDLNAIRSVIVDKVLGDEKLERAFLKHLKDILDRKADDDTVCIFEYDMALVTSSAGELSEALLRTIGKWED